MMKRRYRITLSILAFPLMLAALALILLAGLIYTEAGRKFALEQALGYVSGPYEIEVEGIQSASIGGWRFERLTLADGQGIWLEMQDVAVEFDPSALLGGNYRLDMLTARQAVLHRLPESEDEREDTAPWQGIAELPEVAVERFAVDEFILHAMEGGAPSRLSMAGGIDLTQGRHALQLEATPLGDTQAGLSLATEQVDGGIMLRAQGYEASAAWLALALPELAGEPWRASLLARLIPQGERLEMAVEQLQGTLVGTEFALTGQGSIGEAMDAVQIAQAQLLLNGSPLRFSGLISRERLDVQVQSEGFALSTLEPWLDLPVSGKVAGDVHVAGSPQQPVVAGQARLDGQYDGIDLVAEAEGTASAASIALDRLVARAEGGELTASGRLVPGGKADMQVALEALPVRLLEPWLDLPPELTGRLSGSAQIAGSLQRPRGDGRLSFAGQYGQLPVQAQATGRADGTQLVFERLQVDAGEAVLLADGSYHFERGFDMHLQTEDFPVELLRRFTDLPPELAGNLTADMDLTGRPANPQLAGSADFDGRFGERPLTLHLAGAGTPQAFTIEELWLQSGEDRLTASGSYAPGAIELHIEGEGLDSELLELAGLSMMPGEIDVDIDIAGSVQQPTAKGFLCFTGSGRTPLVAEAQLRLADDRRIVSDIAFLEGGEGLGSAHLEIPVSVLLPGDAPRQLDGSIALQADVTALSRLFPQQQHRLAGQLVGEVALGGTPAAPQLTGGMQLVDGEYRNSYYGTHIEDVALELGFAGQRVTVEQGRGRGVEGGQVVLAGHVDWGGGSARPIQLNLTAENASLVRRTDLTSHVTGELDLVGDFERALLSGQLEITPLLLGLDVLGGQDIPQLNTIDADLTEAERTAQQAPSALDAYMPEIALDIALVAPRRIFVQGRGLDAEFGGQIAITGTAENPRYRGGFEVIRGEFDFLGTPFALQRGDVTIRQDRIRLDARAAHQADDAMVYIDLEGYTDDLDVSLASDPAMPEEEIFSQILFGQRVASLSPLRALQLADAIQTLRGRSSGAGVIGSTQQALGLDDLTLDQGDEGVELGAGKYLSDDVYLGVRRGMGANQALSATVEVDLTPNISLESSTGAEGMGDIQLNWKKDY